MPDEDVYVTAARAWRDAYGRIEGREAQLLTLGEWPPLRAAVDAVREPLLAEIARLIEQDTYLGGVVDEVKATNGRLARERDEARRRVADVRTYADECIAADERYANDLAGAQRGITGRHLLHLLDATPVDGAAP